ncbi:MAG: hypothetical protein Q9221_005557 [Calogaya cf. arnoldii]
MRRRHALRVLAEVSNSPKGIRPGPQWQWQSRARQIHISTPSASTNEPLLSEPIQNNDNTSPDAKFEISDSPLPLLNVSLSASQNLYTRRGTLVGLGGKPDNVSSRGGVHAVNLGTFPKTHWGHPLPLPTNIVYESSFRLDIPKTLRLIFGRRPFGRVHGLDGHWSVAACMDRSNAFRQTNYQPQVGTISWPNKHISRLIWRRALHTGVALKSREEDSSPSSEMAQLHRSCSNLGRTISRTQGL